MKWTAEDTKFAIAFGLAAAFMLGLYGYIGYRYFQMGGWL